MTKDNTEYFDKFDSNCRAILQNSLDSLKEFDRQVLLPSDILLSIAKSDSKFFNKLCELLGLKISDVETHLNWMCRTAWKSEPPQAEEGIYVSSRCRRLFIIAQDKSPLFEIAAAAQTEIARISIPGLVFAAMIPEDGEFNEILESLGGDKNYRQNFNDKLVKTTGTALEPTVVKIGRWIVNSLKPDSHSPNVRESNISRILAECSRRLIN